MITFNEHVSLLNDSNAQLFVKREDLIHPFISGNKFRKLKYNLIAAKQQGHHTLLTFGGAFSNHIAATAYAGSENNVKTIGVIRGEEIASKLASNDTLTFAKECGMELIFISRQDYKLKDNEDYLNDLKKDLGSFYLLPEGGTNELAVKGCEEILSSEDSEFDFISTCVGTGGTISGLINSAFPHQKILGFPALKGSFLNNEICKFAKRKNWELISDYHFGGYARINEELIAFINNFNRQFKIPLDPVYTGKMMFGLVDLINRGYFPKGAKILAIHTGGLQGIKGMNMRLKMRNLPLIKV